METENTNIIEVSKEIASNLNCDRLMSTIKKRKLPNGCYPNILVNYSMN